MRHKFLHISAAAVACLLLSGCYELMLVPVYVSDNTVRPSRYNVDQFGSKDNTRSSSSFGGVDATAGQQESGREPSAPQTARPAGAGSGLQAMKIMLGQARANGRFVYGDDTTRTADTLAAADTLTLVSTDEERVADWMLARIYERFAVVVDYDRRSGTYSCLAYRRRD